MKSTVHCPQSSVSLVLGALACFALHLFASRAAAQEPSVHPPEAGAWKIDFRAVVWPATAKGRVRDGEDGADPESVLFGPDLDAGGSNFGMQSESGFEYGPHRFAAYAWSSANGGSTTLDEDFTFAGTTLAAGTRVETELDFLHVRFEYLYAWRLGDSGVSVRAGGALEYTAFRARLDPDGGDAHETALRGFYPTPQASIAYEPADWIELSFRAGGFFLPFVNGDIDVLQPIEFRPNVRLRRGGSFVDAGYMLYHVHLEENAGSDEEDVVHLRMRGFYFGIGFEW